MDYIVITGNDYEKFIEEVKTNLKKGYELQGGVSIAMLSAPIPNKKITYGQAMIKAGARKKREKPAKEAR